MENKNVTRRRALHVIGMTAGGLVMAACAKEGAQSEAPPEAAGSKPSEEPAKVAEAPAADDCAAEIEPQSQQLRTTLGYVAQSPNAEQLCSNCAQYVAPAEGKNCGGCKLFSGPVQPKGYCRSWAKMPS